MPRARLLLTWCGVLLLVLVPVIAGLLDHQRKEWHPEGDDATIVLLAGDTFRGHPPLVGMISTGGESLSDPELHHPGPLELYVLAPLTSSGLGPATGAVLTAALMAAASILAMLTGLWALGGTRLAFAGAVGVGLLLWGVGTDVPVSVWNPYVVVLPFAAFLVHAVLAATDRPWALVAVVVLGSFVAQTHLSYTGLVGVVVAWVAVLAAWRQRRRPLSRLRPHAVALATGLVLWVPPVLDQMRGDPGNLSQIWRSFTGSSGEALGATGLALLGERLVPLVGWAPRADVVLAAEGGSPWWAVVVLLLVTAGLGLVYDARRRGRPDRAWALATTVVVLIAASVTALRIPVEDDLVYAYYGLWMWPVGVVVWLVGAWSVAGARTISLAQQSHRWAAEPWGRWMAAAAGAALLVVVALLPRPGPWTPWDAHRRVAGRVAPATASAVPHRATYLVRFRGPSPYLSTGSAVVTALAHRGSTVFIDPGASTPVFPWTERRRHTDQPVDAEIWVVGAADPSAVVPAGARLLAEAPTLESSALAERERLAGQEPGLTPHERFTLDRLDLLATEERVTVWLVEVPTA